VTVRRQREYGMPTICCACGEPSRDERLTVTGSNFNPPRSRFVELHFPLCDRCALTYKTVNRRRNIGLGVSLGLSAVLCGAAFIIPSSLRASDSDRLAFFSEVLLLLAALILVGGLVYRALAVRLSTDRQGADRIYRRVKHAVTIRHIGSATMRNPRQQEMISLAFSNDEFARLFRRMNLAVVMTDRMRSLSGSAGDLTT